VIAYAYKGKLATTMSTTDFWRVRAIRLYPLVIVGALIGALALFSVHGDEPGFDAWRIAGSVLLAMAALPTFLLHNTAMAFPLNGPAWSLFFELVANFVYAPVSRLLTRNRLIVLTIVAAILLAIDSFNRGTIESGWSKYQLLGGVFRVFFGITCGLLLYEIRPSFKLRPIYGWGLMALLGFILLVPLDLQAGGQLLIALGIMPLIVWAGSAIEMVGIGAEIGIFLGALSYPIYILHKPMLETTTAIFRKLDPGEAFVFLWIPAQFLIFIGAAWIALKLIDEPVRKWLTNRFRSPPKLGPAPVHAE
jgi:peptidoglycan/LPS O-acetylase OafA/YrhL